MNIDKYYCRELYISTNLTCNLKCKYCFERFKSNFSFNLDEATEKLSKLLAVKTEHGTRIKLLGGEPFLIFDKIKLLCEYLWNQEFDEKFTICIATNGTLVHGEIQEWLAANKDRFRMTLSLDGTKKSQDINRPNSFEKIDIPFFVNTWPEIRVNMAITPNTVPYLAENIFFLHSVGLNNIQANFALETDWADKSHAKTFYLQLLKIVAFYLENQQLRPCSILNAQIEQMLIPHTGLPACGIGRKNAYDFDSKQHYPCHMFFPSVYGKVIPDEIRLKDFSKKEELLSDVCTGCSFVNICRTCYAENYLIRGDFASRDMNVCLYQKVGFVALFRYEYCRIIRIQSPTQLDVRKMQTIQKYLPEIESIEKEIME